DSPEIIAAMKQDMLESTQSSPELQKAPLFIREALLFPYNYGLDYTIALLNAGGKQKAFAGAFDNPPVSSRQIMEPETYLSGERLEPLPLPDFEHVFQNYDRFDVRSIGEFDVSALIEQYAGTQVSKRLYPHWRGGYYYAARPKGNPSAPIGVMYLSRWSNAE